MPHGRAPELSRKGFLALGGTLALSGLAAACASPEASESEGGTGSWKFTDDRGETVSTNTVPTTITAFVGTAAVLHDYGVECAAVFGPTKSEDGSPDVQAGDLDVDGVTVLGNAWGEFNIEEYAALEPDLLVSSMYEDDQLWYVPQESADEILGLAPSIGLNVAGVSLPEPLERHAELAEALGADMESAAVTEAKDRFDAAVESLRKAATDNPDTTVLAASGSADLFYASAPDPSADLRYFHELGVNLVVPDNLDEDGFFESLSWENADKYDADIIMLDNRSTALQPDDLTDKPMWNELPAVGADQVIPWVSEPRFSYAGCAPLLESLAQALNDADKVT
ncbi:iron complex transport system substrate-binding protein [Haloactinospora alba]|uniref:Iron complex transport system substrate-binding protein n=1 Tax=Haloactinospora alba TaxID=405555 RepID=A0A543NHU9_9ACTN|nr:ABC transporter substrate-binding protein [Haloactinospora alba]TQN31426.1 iron complex transport system substrate-binding protein [Haloactinospora alba]